MRKRIYLFSILSLLVSAVFGQDLLVVNINSPGDACGHTGSESVSITVFNAGGSTANAPYTISYQVDGGSIITQNITGAANNINATSFKSFTFSTTTNMLVPKIYDFKSWVTLAADANHTNDTSIKVVHSDSATVAGVLNSADTVCFGANGDTLVLTGNTGAVISWEFSINAQATWNTLGAAGTDSSFIYSNLTQTTDFRVFVRSGVCSFESTTPITIQVDPGTVAGTISGAGAVCLGSSGTLTLTGSSGSIIDWETSQNPAGPWTGASNTTTTFNYTNVQTTSDTLFRVIVKLGVCPEDTSPVAALTLDPASVGGVVSQTVGTTPVCSGSNTGKLKVNGFVGTITNWEISTGGPFSSIGQAGVQEITFTNITQTSTYRARITSGSCPSIVSTTFTITVNPSTVGGTVNSNATICQGGGGSLTLTGNVGTVQFWEQSINGGGTWSTILPINTTTSHTYTSLLATTLFRAQVKSGSCITIPSTSVTITVNSPTVGGTISTLDPTTVCAGNNTGDLSYSGGNGTVVDWEESTNGGVSFASVPGPAVTAAAYTFTNITTTTLYRVRVQNSPCAADFSDTIAITVLPASVAGTISGTSPICSGSTVNLSLTGSAGTVQTWRVSTNGGASFSNVGGSAGQTSISPTVSANSLFQVIVQNGTCDADTTTNFTVNVDPVSVGGSISGSATPICSGSNSGLMTLSGHTGTIIDWNLSINGGTTWTSVPGPLVTIPTFTSGALTQTTMYRVRIKSGVCAEVQSATFTITVIPAAVGGTASLLTTDTLCAINTTVTVQLSGHTGTVIGWEASENGGTTYSTIGGANGTPESFSYNFTTNTLFRAQVQNGASCPIVNSSTVLVVVGTGSVGGAAAGTDTVCGGSNNGFVTLSGHTGSVVRWESSTNGGLIWTPETNSDSVAFNYVGLNNTTLFRAIVQDVSCPSAISDSVEIVIIPAAIGGSVAYAGPNVCTGNNNVTLNLSGSSGTILNWEKSVNGVVWNNIANSTTTLIDSDLVVTTHYRAVLKSGLCPSVPSTPDTVFVDQLSDAGTISGTSTQCETGNSGFVLITGFTGNVVTWQNQLNGSGFASIGGSAGQDTVSYLSLPAGAHDYKAIADNGVCPNDTSSIVTVTITPDVDPGTLTGGTSHCSFTNSTFMQLNGYVSSVVRWQQSTNGGTTFTNIAGTVGRDTITFKNVLVNTIYRVIVSSGVCGNDTSNTQSINVGQSIGGTLSQGDTVCISGHTALMTVTGFNGSIIAWQDSVSGGSWINHSPTNAGIDTLRYTNLTQTTSYRVAVQSGTCATEFSNFITILVNDTVFAGTLGPNLTFCDTSNSDTILLTNYFGPIKNWSFAINGGAFTDFAPVKTDSAFIFNNLLDSITEFRVIMDGGVCGSDTSNISSVKVGASLGGILSLSDTVCLGNNSGVIRLLNYQGNILGWDSSTVSGVFASMSHTLDSLVYTDLNDTVTYRVRVENPGCPADTSNEVTILTVPGTDAGILTGSRSICSTTNSDTIILTGRSGIILLWQSSINNGATWDTILGQSTDTLIFTNLNTTTLYRVIIAASGICPNDTSNIVTIQVGPSDAGSISGTTILCAGEKANLSLGGFTGSVVIWQFSFDGLIWNPLPASDTSNILPVVTQNTFFRSIVQSDTCSPDTSSAFTVNADQPFTGSLITPTTFLCYGIGSDTVFISAAVDTVFDWEFRADTSAAFTSLANTGTFQTYNNLTITTHVRAFVKNGVCPVDTTQLTLTVDTFTLVGSIFKDDTICAGINNGLVQATGFIANTFNWQFSTNGGASWASAPGATNDSFYVYNNLLDTTMYRLILSSGGCPADTTNSVGITVKPSAIGGLILSDTSFCKVPNGGVLKLSGYAGNIVGWQQSIGGSGFVGLTPPVVIDSLVYINIDTNTTYRVIVSLGDCPDDTSATASITILKTPVTSISASGATDFCEGGQVSLTATGGPGYSWSTGDSIDVIVALTSGNYVVVVTDSVTGCFDTDSVTITVFPLPVVDAGNTAVILEGQSTALLATGATSYEWSPKASLSDGFIPNPVATPADSTLYTVVGSDDNGCIAQDSVLVAVIPTDQGPPTFTNLFTPNGDGHNDKWNITGIADCQTCQVAIYNRYGQPIIEDSDYQNDWEGTFNGSKLPDGTYYYVIETEKGKIFKGAITILRGE